MQFNDLVQSIPNLKSCPSSELEVNSENSAFSVLFMIREMFKLFIYQFRGSLLAVSASSR